MNNEQINDMLASVLSNDKEGFSSAFKNELQNRIGSQLSDKSLEISKNQIL